MSSLTPPESPTSLAEQAARQAPGWKAWVANLATYVQPNSTLPINWRLGLIGCAGVGLIIGLLAYASFNLQLLLILGSFGSTSVLLFCFPENPFSQPRNIIGGHFIASAVGLLCLQSFGMHWWALGLAVALSALAMMATRCMHPPAGSNPVIVFLAAPTWSFVWFPTFFGALVMVLVAVFYHRRTGRAYPHRFDSR